MSLIADALKTAQRQKQLRETRHSGGAPLLVQLRPQDSVFGRRRVLLMALAVVTVVAAVGVLSYRLRPKPALIALPPLPSPLAGTPLLGDPSSAAGSPAPVLPGGAVRPATSSAASRAGAALKPPVRADSVPHATIPAGPPRGVAIAPRSAESARAVRRESLAEPQGQPRPDSAPPPLRASPPGRLRIAVEEPATSDAARLFAEALAAHRAGDLVTARPLYERVLAISPNNADALNNLGVLLSAQREFDRALDLLRRAASVAPDKAGTWNNIGAVLREQGHGADASAAFRHALTIDPVHQGAKVGLAQQYLATGAAAQARVLLEQVLSLNPDLAEAHYTLGQTLEVLGDRGGAVREFSAFIRLAPSRLAEHVERVRRHVDSLSGQP